MSKTDWVKRNNKYYGTRLETGLENQESHDGSLQNFSLFSRLGKSYNLNLGLGKSWKIETAV